MQIEVNAYTIVKYGLVQLTGNSVEELLTIAQEAKDTGHVLTVEVPDDVSVNIFDAAQGRAVDEAELRAQDHVENPIMSGEGYKVRNDAGRVIEVTVEGVVELPDDDAVDGEIMEED